MNTQASNHRPQADAQFLRIVLALMVVATVAAGSICTSLAYAQIAAAKLQSAAAQNHLPRA
jgi:hypothetical protein